MVLLTLKRLHSSFARGQSTIHIAYYSYLPFMACRRMWTSWAQAFCQMIISNFQTDELHKRLMLPRTKPESKAHFESVKRTGLRTNEFGNPSNGSIAARRGSFYLTQTNSNVFEPEPNSRQTLSGSAARLHKCHIGIMLL